MKIPIYDGVLHINLFWNNLQRNLSDTLKIDQNLRLGLKIESMETNSFPGICKWRFILAR